MEEKIYEKCYVPEKDASLKKLGLEVCARAVARGGRTQIRIVFRRGGKESVVDCIRTFVGDITIDPESEYGIKEGYEIPTTRSIEDKRLSPEDSFFSIKSFTQQLVETGIQKSLIASFKHKMEIGSEPAWFNEHMRNQIARAITEVAPEETKEIALESLKYITANDPERMEVFSQDFDEVICNHFTESDIMELDKIGGGINNIARDIQECLASNPHLPEKIMKEFTVHRSAYIREELAKNPTLTEEIIEKLSKDVEGVVATLFTYQNIPLEDMQKYLPNAPFKEMPFSIKLGISLNPYISKKNIKQLDLDTYELLQQKLEYWEIDHIAELPHPIIEALATHLDDKVRLIIAEHAEHLPRKVQEKLAKDNIDIKESILLRHDTHGDILIDLYEELVGTRIKKEVFLEEYFKNRGEDWLPDELLYELANDDNNYIRYLLSRYILDLPDMLVKKFIKDPDWEVRAMMAERDDVTIETLKILAEDNSPDVRYVVAKRLFSPPITKLYRQSEFFRISHNLLDKLKDDEDEKVRNYVRDKTDFLPIF